MVLLPWYVVTFGFAAGLFVLIPSCGKIYTQGYWFWRWCRSCCYQSVGYFISILLLQWGLWMRKLFPCLVRLLVCFCCVGRIWLFLLFSLLFLLLYTCGDTCNVLALRQGTIHKIHGGPVYSFFFVVRLPPPLYLVGQLGSCLNRRFCWGFTLLITMGWCAKGVRGWGWSFPVVGVYTKYVGGGGSGTVANPEMK